MYINPNNNFSPRIATYSQDGLGLGHMRRTHLIARQLLHPIVADALDHPVHHFRRKRARRDSVHIDVERPPLHRERFGHAASDLGRAVERARAWAQD